MSHIRSFKEATPHIGNNTYIDESSRVIGDVIIGNDCSVWPMAVIRGDVHHIGIGHRTNIQDGSVLHVTHYDEYQSQGSPLYIGNDVTVGHSCVLHACTIGDRCLIGMHSTILDDAIIHDDVMLAAGTLVPPGKTLESGYLYRGSPAKVARELTDDELAFLSYSAKHYVELKDTYLKELAT